MQYLPGRRELALVAALAFATAGSAFAQDTTEAGGAPMDTTQPAAGALDTAGVDSSAISDTTDTSAVQNPPGYRGMERDTTIFPPKRGGDTISSDTSGGDENDGYRLERPAAADSAAHDSMQQSGEGVGDTSTGTPDSTQ
jgi:hypothetical protein